MAIGNLQHSITTSVLTAIQKSGVMAPAPGHPASVDKQKMEIMQLLADGRIKNAFNKVSVLVLYEYE